ncbi:MAG: phosphatidate cytidylyltransferase [Bacteroidota bacterium]
MIWTIYFVILAYFILGFIGFYFINRKKEKKEAQKSWLKFITYFLIVHLLFFSIAFMPLVFRVISVGIIAVGFYELFRIYGKAGYEKRTFFMASVALFSFLSLGFYFFSGLHAGLILFSFLILSIFDSFSQITGQLWGRTGLLPKVSPQKTLEGLTGGAVVAVLSSYWLKDLVQGTVSEPVVLALGITVFAFLGDIAASYYKRNYHAKDFSRLLPGHGGFLDRFDSLIAGGAFVAWSGFMVGF